MAEQKKGVLWGLYAAAIVPLVGVIASAAWLYDDIYVTAGRFTDIERAATSEGVNLDADAFLADTGQGSDGWPAMEKLEAQWLETPPKRQEAVIASLRNLATPFGNDSAADLAAYSFAKPLVDRYVSISHSARLHVPRDWSSAQTSEEGHARPQIQLGRLVSAFAAAEARQGSVSASFQSLRAVIKIGALFAHQGGIDALSAQVLMESMALTEAARILVTLDTPEANRQYRRFVDDRPGRPDVLSALEGEACRSVAVLTNPGSFDGSSFSGARLSASLNALQRASAVRMAEFWTGALSEAHSTAGDPIELAKIYSSSTNMLVGRKSASSVMVATIARWHQHRIELAAALEVKWQLAGLLGRIHKPRKAWPDFLDAPGGHIKDPFGEGSLEYVQLKDGFKVYSIGKDQDDNGGVGRPNGRGCDIVLAVEGDTVTLEGF